MRLGELISPAKVSRCGDRELPILSITKQDGIVLQSEKFKKKVASADASSYKVVPRGKLVQGIHIDEANFGIQDLVDEGIVSPAYKIWDVNEKLVLPEYLAAALRSECCIAYYRKNLSGTVHRRGRMSNEVFYALEINVPSLDEQLKSMRSLDEVLTEQKAFSAQLDKLDELVKSRFVEMFGELSESNYEGDTEQLSNLADIVSGITKGRKVSAGMPLREVPYMAVSNVKDGYIDWTKVKTIEATDAEIERYRLEPYDVLMTEGGDPDKLGRGALLMEPPDDCIHQNHVFRVRIKDDRLKPEYFEYYLQSPKAKDYFLSCAKRTTGIATINKKQISSLPVIIPGIERQQAFMAFVQQVDKLKFETQQAIDKLQMLYDSLAQEYFGSE